MNQKENVASALGSILLGILLIVMKGKIITAAITLLAVFVIVGANYGFCGRTRKLWNCEVSCRNLYFGIWLGICKSCILYSGSRNHSDGTVTDIVNQENDACKSDCGRTVSGVF